MSASSTSPAQLQRVASSHTGFDKISSRKFIRNVIILVVLLMLLSFVRHLILNDGDVERFDPYKILGISIGTSTAEIKKAYRKLSLKFHPDKNIGDKFAEEMFMTIAKAYEALTDEEAKANYEKYGNPDGRQATELSIGLPSFLLDYPKVVLVLYLITMIIGIPAFVFTFYNRESRKERRNMSVKDTLVECMKAQRNNKVNIVELCAVSRDCINVVDKSAVLPDRVEELSKKLVKLMPKISEDNSLFEEDLRAMYCYCLLHIYLLRNAVDIGLTDNECLLMHQLALKVPAILTIVLDLYMDEELFENVIVVMKFHQSIIQGVWNIDAVSRDNTNRYNLCPYYQLPHLHGMNAEELNSVAFKEFLENPNNHKFVQSLPSKNQVDDILKVVAQIPRFRHTIDIFVEEKDIEKYREMKQVPVVYEGEGLTVRVSLEDLRNDKRRNTHVHSSVYDDPIDAGFWAVVGGFITDQRRVKRFILLDAPKRIAKLTPTDNVFTLRFQVHRLFSSLPFKVWIISDSYLGLDIEEEFSFEVRPADEAPAPVELSAEDLEAMKEPTQMELLFSTIDEEDSSSDEDEVKPVTKTGTTAIGNASEKKVKQGVVEEDDE